MASQHSVLDDLLDNVPQDADVFVQLISDLAEQVKTDMIAQGLNRRMLAQRLGKSESEITKWLSGLHNLTLQSVAKLSAALQQDLLVTRQRPQGYFGQQAQHAVDAGATQVVLSAEDSSVNPPQPMPKPERLADQAVANYMQDYAELGAQSSDSAGDYSYAMAA